MKKFGFLFTVLLAFIVSAGTLAHEARAFKEGTLTCFFEVYSKKEFPKVEKLPPFSINIKEGFSQAFKAASLENRLIVAYSPGFSKTKGVDQFIVDMKYDGANSGADMPAVNGSTYTVKISRDDSDLVGAFLNCKADLKE